MCFGIPPSFIEYFFSFCHRCSGLIFYFLCPSPRISHSSKKPWVLLVENIILKSHNLGTKCAHCHCYVTVPKPYQCAELGNTGIYIYVYQYIYL